MRDVPRFSHPNLLIGSESNDDAGVFLLHDGLALIQTVDFFTPMVDDPYLFGAIAAANALSDIYAMGGAPLTALNIAAFPACEDKSLFARVLQGGADKVREAGALLLGGHTITDEEPKYGLAVSGTARPEQIIANSGAAEGDLLFLTKPLGVGIITTALKNGLVTEEQIMPVLRSMAALNGPAARVMVERGVKGGTDVTGFGLLGHLYELAAASGLAAELWMEAIPLHPQAEEWARQEIAPGGAYRNLQYLGDKVRFAPQVAEHQRLLLADPQTSGGLLMAAPQRLAGSVEGELEAAGLDYAIIGRMRAGSGIDVLPA
jgi:selenide,water dikinase